MNWPDLLQTHGYWVLALGCLLEGETLLVLAGFAVHRKLLDPVVVVAVAAAAGFFGDQFYFWLGRRHGSQIVSRWPLVARNAERARRLVQRWDEWLIIGVRFAYGLRIAGPVFLGMSGVAPRRFALFNAIGAVVWALVVGGIGWLFGAVAEAVLGEIRHIEGTLLLGLAFALVVFSAARWWHLRQRVRSRSEPRDDQDA